MTTIKDLALRPFFQLAIILLLIVPANYGIISFIQKNKAPEEIISDELKQLRQENKRKQKAVQALEDTLEEKKAEIKNLETKVEQ